MPLVSESLGTVMPVATDDLVHTSLAGCRSGWPDEPVSMAVRLQQHHAHGSCRLVKNSVDTLMAELGTALHVLMHRVGHTAPTANQDRLQSMLAFKWHRGATASLAVQSSYIGAPVRPHAGITAWQLPVTAAQSASCP